MAILAWFLSLAKMANEFGNKKSDKPVVSATSNLSLLYTLRLFSKIRRDYFQLPSVEASVLEPTFRAFSLLLSLLSGLIGAGSLISNTAIS